MTAVTGLKRGHYFLYHYHIFYSFYNKIILSKLDIPVLINLSNQNKIYVSLLNFNGTSIENGLSKKYQPFLVYKRLKSKKFFLSFTSFRYLHYSTIYTICQAICLSENGIRLTIGNNGRLPYHGVSWFTPEYSVSVILAHV